MAPTDGADQECLKHRWSFLTVDDATAGRWRIDAESSLAWRALSTAWNTIGRRLCPQHSRLAHRNSAPAGVRAGPGYHAIAKIQRLC